jgi:putative DNA primase/helicase
MAGQVGPTPPVMSAAEVAAALGDARRSGAQWLARCPAHPDRSPSLALRDCDDGKLLAHCHAGCSSAVVLEKLRQLSLLPSHDAHQIARERNARPEPLEQDKHRLIICARAIWNDAIHPRGTIVEAYLEARGFMLSPAVQCLRYHPRCPRGTDRLPAMIAEMRGAATDEFAGVHRTYLMPDGSGKANVEPQRMALGSMAGAVIKITADEDVTTGLGICEGVEDAVAVLKAGWRPIWCCMSAGNLGRFPVLPGIEALTVFADADRPGMDAAHRAAECWFKAGREARVVSPKHAKDFGEALR